MRKLQKHCLPQSYGSKQQNLFPIQALTNTPYIREWIKNQFGKKDPESRANEIVSRRIMGKDSKLAIIETLPFLTPNFIHKKILLP